MYASPVREGDPLRGGSSRGWALAITCPGGWTQKTGREPGPRFGGIFPTRTSWGTKLVGKGHPGASKCHGVRVGPSCLSSASNAPWGLHLGPSGHPAASWQPPAPTLTHLCPHSPRFPRVPLDQPDICGQHPGSRPSCRDPRLGSVSGTLHSALPRGILGTGHLHCQTLAHTRQRFGFI